VISITFESLAAQLDLGALKLPLRAHLHGEQSFVAALTDCLFVNVLAAYVEPERNGRWTALRNLPIAQAGFDEDDALIDYPAKSHPAYRLLTEYFAFPQVRLRRFRRRGDRARRAAASARRCISCCRTCAAIRMSRACSSC
jgi:type VI protein secretion system component VasA